MRRRLLIGLPVAVVVAAGAVWAGRAVYMSSVRAASTPATTLPATHVKRGDVVFTVAAKGELQGGNTEMLSAPMTGGGPLVITVLRESGDLVKPGDVVVQFDTTEQEFKLREAEADLAEAEQQVAQAEAESEAKAEEARYALLQAQTDLRIAELECRRNELVSRMQARQNDLAAAAAKEKVQQLEKDLDDRIAAAKAGIAIQEAARSKAKVASETARRNIDSMTLKAKTAGYVARQPNNTEGGMRWGTYLPALQVGDNVRAGMGVAQIPDMHSWEATARIGELDRGHLAVGQEATIEVVALPGRTFKAAIKSIGGTTGPPWDRHFETKLAIADPTAELRPGMSARLSITTGTLKSVLYLPSQALFESDGRKFVYVAAGGSFTPKDVKLVRRSESQVVVEGLNEGQLVALADPQQMKKAQPAGKSGAMQAISR